MASDTLERLEKKGELGDLIEFVGRPVYQDPLIRVLIDHAPSSKAIEKHMTDVLGWGNDLAERARAALKLRKDHPERWEELGTSMIAPADISFEFDPGWRPHIDRVSALVDCLMCESAFVFGGQTITHPTVLPFFLSEIAIWDGDVYQASFDTGNGVVIPFDPATRDWETTPLFTNFTDPGTGKKSRKAKTDKKVPHWAVTCSINLDGCRQSEWKITTNRSAVTITSCLRAVSLPGAKFPAWCKVVEIRRHAKDPNWRYVIRIVLRRDLAPTTAQRNYGWVQYEKCRLVPNESSQCHWPLTKFDQRYTIDYLGGPLTLQSQTVSVQSTSPEIGKQTTYRQVIADQKAFQKYLDPNHYTLICPPLEEIAGIKLLLEPPASLTDLFLFDRLADA